MSLNVEANKVVFAKKVPTNMDSRYVKLRMLYFCQAMEPMIDITALILWRHSYIKRIP